MKKAKILEKTKTQTEWGDTIHKFKLQTYDEDGNPKKPFTSSIKEGPDTDFSLLEKVKEVTEGMEVQLGFIKKGDYWNINKIVLPGESTSPRSNGKSSGEFRKPIEIIRERALDFANQKGMKVMEITKKPVSTNDILIMAKAYEEYQKTGKWTDEEKEDESP